MENYIIADQFALLAKLMDIHGENSFKAKAYASAAFTLEKLAEPIGNLPEAKMAKIRGLGESAAKKIVELVTTGELKALQELIKKTPEGVLEMMNIKGLGPKKINLIWKEMEIETIEDLQQACAENLIAQKKGFGEKTQQKILESIAFAKENKGQFLYKQIEDFVIAMQAKLDGNFSDERTEITGSFRRQEEIISEVEWVTTTSSDALKQFIVTESISIVEENEAQLTICAEDIFTMRFYFATEENFASTLLRTSSSKTFYDAWRELDIKVKAKTEEELFKAAGLHFIPAPMRESADVLERAKTHDFKNLVQTSDIKGLIHSHSDWSDGGYSIEAMAEELITQGFEYLVISDHSKAAYYANGLSEQKINEQHKYIDELNRKFHPFKIFKSIECDILSDGTLDYDNEVLSRFDLVITSIHSNLDMDEDKAMQRLLGAINNPYTTILGHMTGRLLLKRKGYPVDHAKIIDACATNKVVIEINASPKRLDIDWRWVDYALSKGVLLSINPDAHSLEEFGYVKYGTLVAQKGGLTADRNLSSFSLSQFESFLLQRKKDKGLL